MIPGTRIRRMCHKTKGAAKRGGIQLGTKIFCGILQSLTGPRMDGRIGTLVATNTTVPHKSTPKQ